MMSTATKTREKPIIFGAESIRQVLAGRKTQTRRVVKPQPDEAANGGLVEYRPGLWGEHFHNRNPDDPSSGVVALSRIRCSYGRRGDHLFGKETWRPVSWASDGGWGQIEYKADGDVREVEGPWSFNEAFPDSSRRTVLGWRSPLHMPRWASRLLLEIEDVRVERLQEISEEDARAEGAPACVVVDEPYDGLADARVVLREAREGEFGKHRLGFQSLWDAINGKKHPWESNPYVWAISFRRVS